MFVDSAFTLFKSSNAQEVIIDLRNNLGGHDALSNYLVSYFADESFKWCSKFRIKTSALLKEVTKANSDLPDDYSKRILEEKDGKAYKYDFGTYDPQADSLRFKGNVYVNKQFNPVIFLSHYIQK